MKLRKRVFSILMMLCMIVTLVPASYSATETGTETENGTLTYVWNFAEADGTAVSGMTVSLNFCNSEQETTGGVNFAQSTEGCGACEVSYSGDKFVYEGAEYSYIRMDFALPEGYVINTQDGAQVTNAVSFRDVATLKEIQNVTVHTQVDKVESNVTGFLNFVYEMHEGTLNNVNDITAGYEIGDVVEGGSVEVYFSNKGADGLSDWTTETESVINWGSTGTIQVEYINDKFLYNGQEFDLVHFAFIRPDGYKDITGSGTAVAYYTVDVLKNAIQPAVYCMFADDEIDSEPEKPEVNTEILVKFMHGSAALNTPCKNTEAQAVDLGSQQYTITVDEEDITVDANGTLYLTTSLNEMFPNGLPEAPDHEVAGKFLGWWKAYNGNTIEDYCYQPDDEVNLQINTADNSVSFTAVYDRIISPYKISYIDEMGNEISNQFYMTYVDFPKTFGEKLEQTLDVVETFGLKHVGSFGEISTKVTATYPEEMYPTLLAQGSIVDVTYTYEYNRTDTTFEKTEYTFGLEDGTIVDGVKVKVSLCNGMNDADKVTIETSTSGQGDFVIEHIDDVIYYGGNTYDTIEFEYDFPEGYVIKDSDITGTTVWYTATDWCEGGGAFWLLEKLPEVPAEPEVEIIIPEDDAPAEEEVKVEVPVEKPVVSEEKMDDIIEANKKHPVKIETNDDVTIEFPAGGMKPVEGKHDYDFGVKIEKDYDKAHDKHNHGGQHVDEHRKFKEDEFVLRINYNYSGELPGEAEISIPVGKEWAGKRLYYYQLMEDGSYHYTGQHAVVDEHGYFRVKQGHCSDYVVVTAAPTSELLYYLYSTDAASAASNTSPKTGDNNMFAYLMMIAATGVVVTTAMRRKVK